MSGAKGMAHRDEGRRHLSGKLRSVRLGLVVLAGTMAGAAAAEEGNIFSNMLKYGGTTVPPSQPQDLGEVYCPQIDVPEGGAAMRAYGGKVGDGASLRSQITLGRLARECTRLADGTVGVKVGIAGQVLLGPSGSPGRFEALLQVSIKYADKVVVTRAKRVPIVVAAGEAQGLFSVIEDNLVVPAAMAGDYEISVSLGGGPARPAGRKRKPVAAVPDAAGAAQ